MNKSIPRPGGPNNTKTEGTSAAASASKNAPHVFDLSKPVEDTKAENEKEQRDGKTLKTDAAAKKADHAHKAQPAKKVNFDPFEMKEADLEMPAPTLSMSKTKSSAGKKVISPKAAQKAGARAT